MGRKKRRSNFRQRRTGFAERGILTVLFVCVISGLWMTGCGPRWEADFFLEQEGKEGGPGEDPGAASGEAAGQNSVWDAGSGQRTDSGGDPGAVEDSTEEDSTEEDSVKSLYVHVCGAVNSPGLKKLPVGSRAFDALEMADGFSEEADIDAVNLAAPLADGQQLYFPVLGEEADRGSGAESGKVDLNTADEKELCTLKGIGTSRAQDILKYRREKGGFSSIEELMQVPGIKESIFEQICDQITVQ